MFFVITFKHDKVYLPGHEPNIYTITFTNWDGTVLQTSSIEEGQIPVYTGSTPTRPSDSQYNYTFNGWLPIITAATQDVTYTALYTATAIPIGQYVTFTAEEAGSKIGMAKLGSMHTLEYSTDTQNWSLMPTTTYITLTNANDKVYVRGVLNSDLSTTDYTRFLMAGKIAASGNCNAIWNYQDLNAPLKALCGYQMFYNCTSLTTAPDLPSTILARSCYYNMFSDCTSLTTAPALPATTLTERCYSNMFDGCTSLTTAPTLPATTLTERCYNNMFRECAALTTAPVLSATTLAEACYYEMFYGCTSLTHTPELSATTLANSCYVRMFCTCTSLTTAPVLPATTLADYCYAGMFAFCTSLTTAPELSATTLANSCYHLMFLGCASLSSIKCLATDISAEYALTEWTKNVASTGTFVKHSDMNDWPTGYGGIPTGWTVKNEYTITFANWDGTVLQTINVEEGQTPVYTGETPTRPSDSQYNYTFNGWSPAITEATANTTYTASYTATEINVPNYVTFTAEEAGSTLGLNTLGSVHTLEYSMDTQSWTPMTTATAITLANINDKVYVRGVLSANLGYSDCTQFKMTGKIAASGNCNALWNYQDLNAPLKEYCGNSLFYDCTSLTQAPTLPATTLALNCYCFMFLNCTSLTKAPELPATTLAGYCYNGMFRGCPSLTQAPTLPATTLAEYCYNFMFYGCTSLTQAPTLPATTLALNCYRSMFRGCTSLTQAPTLPATTLALNCYKEMFIGCTSLTQAPTLPATTLANGCYNFMLASCDKLSTIKCLATDISASDALSYWTNGVASSGTFYKAAGVEWPEGKSGIPSGWTVVEV